MRSIHMKILAFVAALMMLVVSAEAKWWIFGKSDEKVGLDYLYLNNVAFDEKDTSITLYKDSLPEGNLIIRGKALAGKSQAGAVQVSLDGKETWDKAKISSDGAFEYVFKPDVDAKYDLYIKAIDTTGKSNDVDATHKIISISGESMTASVKQVLEAMVEAYKNEDARKFMSYISQNFAGDDVVLERAIRKDFTAFDNIDLRFTISTTATGSGGSVYVSLLYNRMLISTKTGDTFSDKGTTEFVFRAEKDGLKCFSMKNPLIFGLSDAGNVATGTVTNATTEQMIVVDQNGNVQKLPFDQAINIIEDGGAVAGSGAPAITDITGMKHHMITLHITLNISGDLNDYDMQIEESESPNGPWESANAGPAYSTCTFTTQTIQSKDRLLYYRVRTEHIDSGQYSEWSNVAVWDNI